jgi:hypothetical protein
MATPATPATPLGYVGVRITFGTTAVQLCAAVSAVETNAPTTVRQFTIQSDLANAAGIYILIGDSNVSQTRYGQQLDGGQSRMYPPSIASPLYPAMYVLASSSTLVADVELMSF